MNFENYFPNNEQITNDSSSNSNHQIQNLKTQLDHLDNGNNLNIFKDTNIFCKT